MYMWTCKQNVSGSSYVHEVPGQSMRNNIDTVDYGKQNAHVLTCTYKAFDLFRLICEADFFRHLLQNKFKDSRLRLTQVLDSKVS